MYRIQNPTSNADVQLEINCLFYQQWYLVYPEITRNSRNIATWTSWVVMSHKTRLNAISKIWQSLAKSLLTGLSFLKVRFMMETVHLVTNRLGIIRYSDSNLKSAVKSLSSLRMYIRKMFNRVVGWRKAIFTACPNQPGSPLRLLSSIRLLNR